MIRTAEYTSTVVRYVTSAGGGIQFGTNTTPQSHRYTNLHFAQSIINRQSRELRYASLAERMKVY
jgi:hypothetical protein